MSKSIRFEVDEEQYEWLIALKDKRGFAWKGLMLEGAKCLDSGRQPTED